MPKTSDRTGTGGGGGGGVSSVTASSPLASSGGATPNITGIAPWALGVQFPLSALGTPTDIYVNVATGSDSNNGNTALTPYQTIQRAINRTTASSIGGYWRINVAAGTYVENLVASDFVGGFGSTTYGTNLVELIGDEVTPTNCVISSASTAFTIVNSSTAYRFRGFQFLGGGSGTGISCVQSIVYLANCNIIDFSTPVSATRGGASVVFEASSAGGVISNPSIAFSCSNGAFMSINSNLNVTNAAAVFSASNGSAILVGSALTITATGRGPFAASFVQSQKASTVFVGGSTFNLTDFTEPIRVINGGIVQHNTGITYNLTTCGLIGRVTEDSAFIDTTSGTTTYNLAGTPQVFEVGDSAYFYSTSLPISAIQNNSNADAKFGTDFRYKDFGRGQHLGALPQNVTTYLSASQFSSSLVPLYIATYSGIVDSFYVSTNVSNGPAHTDTYQITLNGAPTTMAISILNGTSGSTTSNPVSVVAGDLIGIQATTDPATAAADLYAQFTVRKT